MIAFGERISNLIASEIIRLDSIKLRAKLIAKYINVARRLEHLQNMHTTKTVLLGLQSPALYRLKKTWTYVRNHHNNKYRRLYIMMKTHKEIRSKEYCMFFGTITETRPYLPALLHIISALFGRLPPKLFQLMSACTSHEQLNNKDFFKLAKNISLWPSISEDSNISETTIAMSEKSISSSGTSLNEETVLSKLKTQPQQQVVSLSGTNSHLEKMMVCLEEWQRVASQFGLMENPVLKEFLLKSRYMEQDECFLMSLKMEPPDPPSKQSLPDIHKIGN
uniref:Putative guanine nucleotide exchange factor for ras-like small gtpase n=1 Tax=Panstrongylus lignarius TaxID=156445 RepID=A0A224XU50_9HEMI